ncbi:MAG TPA: arsenate reductase family protein [Mycobacteriales bacterium]|nr:arsenate reductase family protein [Mycobacteriales bacterium]
MEIWFNPKCSKCRLAKEALDAAGVDYEIRRYLDEPPTADELSSTLDALGLEPWDVTRMSEPEAAELGLAQRTRERESWIQLLVEHPALLQRPIIVTDDGSAWVARDPDTVQAAVGHARSTG